MAEVFVLTQFKPYFKTKPYLPASTCYRLLSVIQDPIVIFR